MTQSYNTNIFQGAGERFCYPSQAFKMSSTLVLLNGIWPKMYQMKAEDLFFYMVSKFYPNFISFINGEEKSFTTYSCTKVDFNIVRGMLSSQEVEFCDIFLQKQPFIDVQAFFKDSLCLEWLNNSKYPNSWLENITFYWKLRIFESAVWVLWVDINENVCLV